MTHDEELGRRALRRVVDRFVRANVGKVIPRQKSQLLSNGSCHKDKHSLCYADSPKVGFSASSPCIVAVSQNAVSRSQIGS